MVAVIHTSTNLRGVLNYNDQKVKTGVASCLAAGNYPIDLEHLTFSQKLNMFQKLIDLNPRTKVNSVHISLNFDPSEQLSEDVLKQIADTYLQKIGFGSQPYLLYQHHDSGHPHLHIVTTNIRPDGKRIELHNLGKTQSEKARKEIEISFGLVKAQQKKPGQVYDPKPVNLAKLEYGRHETRRAITNVLYAVLKTYKYTSLPELNAILLQYNVTADRGAEDLRVYQNNGLTRIVDEQGNMRGVPIKAGNIYGKPTLKFLEGRFKANEAAARPFKARVKNSIDLALLRKSEMDLTTMVKVREKQGITTLLRQNADGLLYGITYVDHQKMCFQWKYAWQTI